VSCLANANSVAAICGVVLADTDIASQNGVGGVADRHRSGPARCRLNPERKGEIAAGQGMVAGPTRADGDGVKSRRCAADSDRADVSGIGQVAKRDPAATIGVRRHRPRAEGDAARSRRHGRSANGDAARAGGRCGGASARDRGVAADGYAAGAAACCTSTRRILSATQRRDQRSHAHREEERGDGPCAERAYVQALAVQAEHLVSQAQGRHQTPLAGSGDRAGARQPVGGEPAGAVARPGARDQSDNPTKTLIDLSSWRVPTNMAFRRHLPLQTGAPYLARPVLKTH